MDKTKVGSKATKTEPPSSPSVFSCSPWSSPIFIDHGVHGVHGGHEFGTRACDPQWANQADAPNAAMTLWFHAVHHGRGVGDLRRWAGSDRSFEQEPTERTEGRGWRIVCRDGRGPDYPVGLSSSVASVGSCSKLRSSPPMRKGVEQTERTASPDWRNVLRSGLERDCDVRILWQAVGLPSRRGRHCLQPLAHQRPPRGGRKSPCPASFHSPFQPIRLPRAGGPVSGQF